MNTTWVLKDPNTNTNDLGQKGFSAGALYVNNMIYATTYSGIIVIVIITITIIIIITIITITILSLLS